MTWTVERVDELKAGWAAGDSCSQIAGRLGITRNAVIGKVHRLKLEGRQTHRGVQAHRTPPKPRPPQLVYGQPSRSTPFLMPRLPVTPLPEMPEYEGEPVAFLNLTEQHCRWPVTDEMPHMFCGATRVEKQAYCGKHCRKSYPGFRSA